MATDDLEWLGTWYQQQCNGRWEHQKGMLLQSLPAPLGDPRQQAAGWQLRIDLRGTTAAGFGPKRMHLCALDGPWLRCALTAQRFEGAGSEVEEVIAVFRRWIDTESPDTESSVFETASAG